MTELLHFCGIPDPIEQESLGPGGIPDSRMWSRAGSVSIFPGPFQTRSTDQSWRLDRRLMGIKSPLAARIAGVCYTLPLVGTISYATR